MSTSRGLYVTLYIVKQTNDDCELRNHKITQA